jgi:hypothetical protein
LKGDIMVPIAKELRNDLFTFLVMNENIPAVFIEGRRLSLVSCELIWKTATDSYPGEYIVLVTGYLDGLPELKYFKYDFISKILREGDGLNGTPTDEALKRLSKNLETASGIPEKILKGE